MAKTKKKNQFQRLNAQIREMKGFHAIAVFNDDPIMMYDVGKALRKAELILSEANRELQIKRNSRTNP